MPFWRRSRYTRSARLSTICRCTHEWSLISSRSAVTCAACQRALSWVSAFAASRNAARRRLRSAGAWMFIAAIASRSGISGIVQ
jgi:hypothetical protein